MTTKRSAVKPHLGWLPCLGFTLAMDLAQARVGGEEPAAAAPPDSLTGAWTPRTHLANHGATPFADWSTEVWGNVAGGQEQGAWWNSLLSFGFEVDTDRLGGWPGGRFLVQAHWVQNLRNDRCFDDYTGGFHPVSSIMAGDHLRVFNLYYQHVWREEAVVVKLGQIAVDDDFMGSEYAALFLNSALGAMPSQVGTPLATSCGGSTAFPIYSVAAPGVFVRVRPAEAFETQAGLYAGRPGLDRRENHGFGWAHESPAELGLFWEGGYHYRVGPRPATVRLGLSYHTGPLEDFRGTWTEEPPATRQTVPNFYLVHDLALIASPQGDPKLGLFVRGGLTPEPDRSMVAAYADAGLNWFAPLPARADDIAGIAVSCTRFGGDFRESTQPDGFPRDETTLEITYRARVTRWMALQAGAQWLFNPAVNPDTHVRETATIVGLRAELSF